MLYHKINVDWVNKHGNRALTRRFILINGFDDFKEAKRQAEYL